MKIFILFALLLILPTACMKEDNPHLISTDFEGKFLLRAYHEPFESSVYTADQGGATHVPVFDSTEIINDGFKWIRQGQFIYYMQFPYCISCSVGVPRIIKPDGTLVRDFKSDFGYVLISEISQQGNRLAFTNSYDVFVYTLNQEFHPILMDSVSSSIIVRSITWSPDEEKFLMLKDGDPTQNVVTVYDLSTRLEIPIFEFSAGTYLELHTPGWSSDGSQVSFIANKILYIGDAKGLGTYPVSTENQPVLNAAWSNTVHELAYVRPSTDSTRIEMMIYDPTSQTSTTLWETKDLRDDLGYYYWRLEWSKDGNSIAFYGTDGEHVGVFIVNRDGTNLRQIFDRDIQRFDWHED